MRLVVLILGTILGTIFLFPFSSLALRVLIDPGHGGKEAGATFSGIREADLTLKVSKKVHALLSFQSGLQSQLSRTDDSQLSLQERIEKANSWNANLLVSIHANSNPSRKVNGVEIYHPGHLPPNEESLFLAFLEENQTSTQGPAMASKNEEIDHLMDDLLRQDKILGSLKLAHGLKDVWARNEASPPHLAVKQAPFYVLDRSHPPSILVEIGFLSNSSERQQLLREDYQQRLAQKIVDAILEYAQNLHSKNFADKNSTTK